MNGSTGKIAPEINLDEFERRLRSSDPAASGAEDPLAELSRLVDMINWDEPAKEPSAPRSGAGRGGTAVVDRAPAVGLGAAEPPPVSVGRAPPTAPSAPTVDAPDVSEEPHAAMLAAADATGAAKGRSRSWWIKTIGLTVVGVALLVGAATLKTGVPGLPKGPPPLIAAAQGPNKVQPPSDATVQATGDAAALLMKDSATPTPVKVVTTEEQPVDLAAQTPGASPQAAIAAPAPAPSPGVSPLAAASPSAASPVAPSLNPPIVAPGGPTATVAPLFPDAKPVKTVSVRPDGTLISVDSTPAPAPAPPPAAPTTPSAVNPPPAPTTGEAATPTVDLPTKMPPKSAARVVARTDTTAPAVATDATPTAPLTLASALPRAAKPAKPAPADADATAPAPAASAPAPTTDAAAPTGGWAVQLAAPRSEADAKSVMARLKAKYAGELGDVELGVREAEVKGETIYRVRVAGLSKADAAALCAKLKAAGGDCFIAKD
jgi:hypothetical protein